MTHSSSTEQARSGQPRYGSVTHFARFIGVHERSVRNWIARGYFPVYRQVGRHGVLINVDEAEAAIRRLADEGKVRLGFTYGPNADVRTLGTPR